MGLGTINVRENNPSPPEPEAPTANVSGERPGIGTQEIIDFRNENALTSHQQMAMQRRFLQARCRRHLAQEGVPENVRRRIQDWAAQIRTWIFRETCDRIRINMENSMKSFISKRKTCWAPACAVCRYTHRGKHRN